jgi:hypothetical protein
MFTLSNRVRLEKNIFNHEKALLPQGFSYLKQRNLYGKGYFTVG